MFARRLRGARASLALGLFSLSACSPGMFFGGQKGDGDLRKIPPYREQDPSCSGVTLGEPEMSTRTFRALFHCFNANGSIAPVVRLMDELSDDELAPIVKLGNRYMLSQPRMLYHLDQAYSSLGRQGKVKPLFGGLAGLIGDGELVAASIELALQAVVVEKGLVFKEHETDRRMLQVIGLLARELSTRNADRLLTAGLALGESPTFHGLQSRFAGRSPGRRTPAEIARAITAFLREQAADPESRIGSLFIDSIATGGSFEVLDKMVGATEEDLRNRTLSFTPVLTVPTGGGGVLMDRISSLFHHLNRPIPCMMGTRMVPNGVRHALREMAEYVPVGEAGDYVQRENLLTLVGMNPFCEYPPQLGQHYQALASVAETNAMKPMSRFVKALWSIQRHDSAGQPKRPMIDLLIAGLSARGPSGETGINLMVPVFAELADRGAWEELVLLASLPLDSGRAVIQDASRFLLNPRAELGGQTIAEVLGGAAGRFQASTLTRVLSATGSRIEEPDAVLRPAFAALRDAFHANDTHPLVELLQAIVAGSVDTPELYPTLLKVSRKPVFREALAWIGGMARDDRLSSLVGGMLTMFRKFSLTGADRPILDTPIPAFEAPLRHRLVKEGLAPYVDPDPPAPPIPACQRLNFAIRLDEVENGGYEEFIDDVVECLGSNGEHNALLASIAHLRAERTDDGRPFFQLPILEVQDLAKSLGREGVRDVVDRFDAMVTDGRLYRLIESMPHLTLRNLGGETFIDPLVRLLAKLQKRERPALQTLASTGAEALVSPDAPHLIRYGEELYDLPDPQLSPANPRDFDFKRIQRWIYNKECFFNPTPGRRNPQWETARANEVVEDFRSAVSGWDLVNGKPRKSYEFDEFMAMSRPLVEKFTDPKQSAPGRPVLDALLSVMRSFATEYTPDDLYDFAYEKSNDVRLSTYFYPGDRQPRVRLMSTLDFLDSVLIDADFTYAEHFMPDNSGMKYQMLLAEAWGDEPRERWPAEMQARHPPRSGTRPMTLAEAVRAMEEELDSMSGLAGLPGLPGCMDDQIADPNDDPETRRRETTDPSRTGWIGFIVERWVRAHLYNLTLALPILRENLPTSQNPNRIGVKLLRNLFWEFHMSTPPAHRNARSGTRNNLSVVSQLVRMGLTRNLTRKLYRAPRDSTEFRDLFRTLVIGGAAPSAPQLFRELFRKGEDVLWEPLLRELFAVVQAPSGEFLTRRDLRKWTELETSSDTRAKLEALLAKLDAEKRDPTLAERKPLRALRAHANEAQRRLLTVWAGDADRLRELFFYLFADVGQADRFDVKWNGVPGGDLISRSARLIHIASSVERKAIHGIVGDLRALAEKPAFWAWMKNTYLHDGKVDEEGAMPPKARMAKFMREIVVKDPVPGLAGIRVLSAFLENGGENEFRRDWNKLDEFWTKLEGDPAFAALRLGEIARDAVHFLQEGIRPGDRETAAKVRLFAAGLMDPRFSQRNPRPRQGDVDQWLELVSRDPAKVRELLAVFGSYAQSGDLRRLLDLAQRSITPAP